MIQIHDDIDRGINIHPYVLIYTLQSSRDRNSSEGDTFPAVCIAKSIYTTNTDFSKRYRRKYTLML